MSTLWTPSGEHEPAPSGDAHAGGTPDEAPLQGSAFGGGAPTATGEIGDHPSAEELAAVRQMHAELRATPVEDVIANHAAGMMQLALIHLGLATPPDEHGSVPPPDLDKAGMAVDALAALVDGLGPRLAAHEPTLREALAQLQNAYVQVTEVLDRAESAD